MKPRTTSFSAGQARDIAVQGANGLLEATHWPAAGGAAKNAQLIVFLDGGNFVADNRAALNGFFESLRDALPDTVLLVPRYTLASERSFPAPLEDVYSVLAWSVQHKARLGWSGKHLVIAGIEAGANLAAAAALVARDRKGPRLDGQILMMPMLDPGLSSQSMRESTAEPGQHVVASRCALGYRGYLPNAADRSHPYATPLNSSRLKDLPPSLIFSAERDPLRDEAEAYAERLIASGVRTSLLRLPPLALEAQDARCECAHSAQVIAEISSFLGKLTSAQDAVQYSSIIQP
jgi:acetyl esterase/lipase